MALTTLTAHATVAEVVQQLRQDGALIIKDLISPELVDQLTTEVRPYIDTTPVGRDEFTGKGTKRTGALAARSATCRDLILNPLMLQSANEFLKPFTRRIILHLTQTIEIGPGGVAQQYIVTGMHGVNICRRRLSRNLIPSGRLPISRPKMVRLSVCRAVRLGIGHKNILRIRYVMQK